MSTGDELTGVVLNLSGKSADMALNIAAQILKLIEELVLNAQKQRHENKLAEIRLKGMGVTGSDVTDIKSGEVALKELVKNARDTGNSVLFSKDGLNSKDKKFIAAKAKEYGIPLAFREEKGIAYPIVRNCDKNTFRQITMEYMQFRLKNQSEKYGNFQCKDWEVPYLCNEMNKYGVPVTFGKTKDGKSFCFYDKEYEQVVKIARDEFVRKYHEINDNISIKEHEKVYTIADKNGHSISFDEDISRPELSKMIQNTFNFDKNKAEILCAKFGNNLAPELKEKFFDESICFGRYKPIRTFSRTA